jgi:nitrate reductase beta subunit
MSGCPYKKVYFNWKTNKAEKCTFCFPRIENGQPTVCSETCVGRLRYIGIILYDADRVAEAASVENEKDLYEAQLGLILNPKDPEVIQQALRDGIPEDWIEAAQESPVYKLAVEHKVALPLHPEYRTMPMVWYMPPLSPFINQFGGEVDNLDPAILFPTINQFRIPIQYLANLMTAGDTKVIERVLNKMVAMRTFMRSHSLGKNYDEQVLENAGLTKETAIELYELSAIAKYDDRYVIPKSHREKAGDMYVGQGSVGFDFMEGNAGGCESCSVGSYNSPEEELYAFSEKYWSDLGGSMDTGKTADF